jgi:hypothetical protein
MVHKIIKIAYISFSNFSNVLKRYPYISTYHYIILLAITYTPFIYINIFIHFALHPHTRLAFCLIESLVWALSLYYIEIGILTTSYIHDNMVTPIMHADHLDGMKKN